MLERADTSEVIDLNTLALPLYSVDKPAKLEATGTPAGKIL
jgi:hypothetical protein